MTDEKRDRPTLKSFDASTDRNGGNLGQDDARDVASPSRTQADLRSNPMGEAESARIASGLPGEDAEDATAAETPPENLRRISDPTPRSAATSDAIDRATASVGKDRED